MSKPLSPRGKDILCLAGLLAGTAAFMLAFTWSTSPLTPTVYGRDAAFFTMCGQAVARGRVPYLDFFDIKGPLIFFAEALGQRLAWGRTGAFFIQFPFTFAAAVCLFLAARQFLSRPGAMAAVVCAGLYLAATEEGGNLTEDFCLPLAALCLLLALRRAEDEEYTDWRLPVFALVCGACSGCAAWVKITHGALIFGAVAYFVCALVRQKNWKCLALCALAYLGGLAAVSAPLVTWFASKGALGELLRGTFIAPLTYAGGGLAARDASQWLTLAKGMAPIAGAVGLVLLTRLHRQPLGRMILCCCAVSAAALVPGYAYTHYFIMVCPYVLLDAALLGTLLRSADGRRLAWLLAGLGTATLLIGALVPAGEAAGYIRRGMTQPVSERTASYREQAALIPPEERDQVLAYETPPAWYVICDILPCYRYCAFDLSTWQAQVTEEYIEMLRTDPPVWYAVSSDALGRGKPLDLAVAEVLARRYEPVHGASDGTVLYRLRAE